MAYVYAVEVEGIVRYIGKGSGRRARSHLKIVRSVLRRRALGEAIDAPSAFYEALCKAYRDGCEITPRIIEDGLDDAAAFRREIELRESFPAGQLWNRKCWDRPEYREKQRARWADPEMKAQHREALHAGLTGERAEKISEAKKANWADPDYRAKCAASQQARPDVVNSEKRAMLHAIEMQPGISYQELKSMFGGRKMSAKVHKLIREGLVERRGEYHRPVYYRTNVEILAQVS